MMDEDDADNPFAPPPAAAVQPTPPPFGDEPSLSGLMPPEPPAQPPPPAPATMAASSGGDAAPANSFQDLDISSGPSTAANGAKSATRFDAAAGLEPAGQASGAVASAGRLAPASAERWAPAWRPWAPAQDRQQAQGRQQAPA